MEEDFKVFIEAICIGNLEIVKRLFKEEFINATTTKRFTALYCARKKGKDRIVKYLLEKGWKDEDNSNNGTLDESIEKSEKNESFEMKYLSEIVDSETKETQLDKLWLERSQETFTKIKNQKVKDEEFDDLTELKSKINQESYQLLKECLLYRCISQDNVRGIERLLDPDITKWKNICNGILEVSTEDSSINDQPKDFTGTQTQMPALDESGLESQKESKGNENKTVKDEQQKRTQQKNNPKKISQIVVKASQEKIETNLKLLQRYSLSKIMDTKNGKTLLDILLTSEDPGIMEAIKSKPIIEQEINDWMTLNIRRIYKNSYRLLHECLLYRCIRHEYCRGFEKLCTPDLVNREKLFMDKSILEIVAATGITLLVNHVLRRMVSVNESWTRAQDIAKTKGFLNVVKMIKSRRDFLRRKYKRGYNRLHIAVHDEAPDMIEYIMEKGLVNANDGDKTIGTALSYAYELDHVDCIDSLQHMEVNTNTTDWLKRTPLHVAISSGIEGAQSAYLVNKMIDIEVEDYRGLRVIDRSILHNCRIICEQLLQRVVKFNKFINTDFQLIDNGSYLKMGQYLTITNQETIFTLCLKQNRTIYPCLLESIDKDMINWTYEDKNTLLHMSASLLISDTCSILIEKSANVNQENNKKNTPLLELLEKNLSSNMEEEKIIHTVIVLIQAGTSCDTKNLDGYRVVEAATLYHSENLLVAIIENVEKIEFMNNDLWRAWVDKKYFILIKKLLSRADKSLNHYIAIDDIKNNIIDADMSLIKSMYDRAERYVQESTVESILYKAVVDNDEATFKEMIDKPIHEKSCLVGRDTLFNYLIRERKKIYIDLILYSKNREIHTEKKNSKNQLPLHVCIETEYWKIIDIMIVNTVMINEEDDDGQTPLSMLIKKISDTEDETILNKILASVKIIISKFGDIDYENKHHINAIDYCTKSEFKSEIQEYARKHRRIAPTIVPAPAPPINIQENVEQIQQGAAAAVVPICRICDDASRNCALNCGHQFCLNCANKEKLCYVCRKLITARIFLYNN